MPRHRCPPRKRPLASSPRTGATVLAAPALILAARSLGAPLLSWWRVARRPARVPTTLGPARRPDGVAPLPRCPPSTRQRPCPGAPPRSAALGTSARPQPLRRSCPASTPPPQRTGGTSPTPRRLGALVPGVPQHRRSRLRCPHP